MIGGQRITDTTRAQAAELLEAAKEESHRREATPLKPAKVGRVAKAKS